MVGRRRLSSMVMNYEAHRLIGGEIMKNERTDAVLRQVVDLRATRDSFQDSVYWYW